VLRLIRAREWEFVGVAAGLILALGAWGYARADEALLDAVYRSLQLFVLETAQGIGSDNWQTEVARYLAPAIAGYVVVRAAALLLRDHLRSLALRRASGHVIVAGLGPEGVQMVRAFSTAGHKVIAVAQDPTPSAVRTCEARGAICVAGSLSSPETFKRLRTHRAKYAFVVAGSDARSVEAGEAALSVARSRPGSRTQIFVQVSEPRLRIHLAAYALVRQNRDGPNLEIFDAFDVAARTMVAERGEFLERASSRGPPNVVVGRLGAMGEALTLHLALAWQRNRGRSDDRLRVTLIDPKAAETAHRLRANYPQLDPICDLEARNDMLEDVEWSEFDRPITGTRLGGLFLCGDEDEEVISPALAAHQAVRRSGTAITVCVTSTAGTIESVLDDLRDPRPVTYSVIELACSPELVLSGIGELMARATHESYLRHERERGETVGTNPSVVPWEELPETLRESNRDQAAHISVKLAEVGCTLVPAAFTAAGDGQVELGSDEIERLAKGEHDRWVRERIERGWVQGPFKDVNEKVHPSLVRWEELPESEREKDRETMRDLPRRLELAGFAIVRV
jgi:RyR domain/TrkA-N domain